MTDPEQRNSDDQPPSRAYDFIAGEILLVNKPAHWTSFDVVNKIRHTLKHATGVKKIKVGHAGTLDPLATGLLIVCTGKATKQIDSLQGLPKAYTGTLLLGATTPSYDAETEVDETFPTEHITPEMLDEARHQFIGPIAQVPPMFSAIKVDGQPLYKKARKGEKLEIESRDVTIYDFDLTRVDLPEVDFRVGCSKGTYIRSLAYDFGRAVGSGAHLTALCRTSIGEHQLSDAWALEDLVAFLKTCSPSEPEK